jgi:CO dehydrogenase maturation factor
VILDMEAGLEHIGRASARGVEAMISVVEPGMRSVQTATRIHKLAKDIGIVRTLVVANKIRQPHELDVLRQALDGQAIIGTLPYNAELARADLEGRPVGMQDRTWAEAVGKIVQAVQDQIDVNPLC